jgi:hypothetical protein
LLLQSHALHFLQQFSLVARELSSLIINDRSNSCYLLQSVLGRWRVLNSSSNSVAANRAACTSTCSSWTISLQLRSGYRQFISAILRRFSQVCMRGATLRLPWCVD